MTGSFKDLKVYQLAFEAANSVFILSKKFPREETYSLTDQIRRSSRSVCANIGEGYRKRIYPKHFTSKITDADGEATETSVWLDFALECKYIEHADYIALQSKYEEIGRMLNSMANNPERFLPKLKSATITPPTTATAAATTTASATAHSTEPVIPTDAATSTATATTNTTATATTTATPN